MIELWACPEANAAHRETEHYQRIVPQLGEFRSVPSEIIRLREFPIE